MGFNPDLSILPLPQLRLWSELDATPETFTLYGGTALALRFGHRSSVDFDFFSNQLFDPDDLAALSVMALFCFPFLTIFQHYPQRCVSV